MALGWLSSNQLPDGSYGAFFEHETAAAAYALWLDNSGSTSAGRAYSYLATQIENPSSWFWTSYGEADVPGNVLYSMAIVQQLTLINDLSAVSSRLLQWQKPNGGFVGYYDLKLNANVTSSMDTAMALWGLTNARAISPSNQASAIKYILSLQNEDGSFNLTRTIAFDPIDSLGPDSASITALVSLVLRDSSFTINDGPISKALNFLTQAGSSNFSGHVYAASLSTLAFIAFSRPNGASKAVSFILSEQNSDGGFSDISRGSHPSSNALDTGWASVALQMGPGPRENVNHPPVAKLSFRPQNPTVNTAVYFTAKGSSDPDGDSLSYLWNFGDGGSATGINATHTYSRSGDFTSILTIIDTGTNPSSLSNTTWVVISVQVGQVPTRAAFAPIVIVGIGLGVALIVAIALVVLYLVVRKGSRTGSRITG